MAPSPYRCRAACLDSGVHQNIRVEMCQLMQANLALPYIKIKIKTYDHALMHRRLSPLSTSHWFWTYLKVLLKYLKTLSNHPKHFCTCLIKKRSYKWFLKGRHVLYASVTNRFKRCSESTWNFFIKKPQYASNRSTFTTSVLNINAF